MEEQGALKELSKLATTEKTAIAVIDQSISRGWQGLFKLKTDGQQGNSNQTGSARVDKFASYLASKTGNNTSQ
jgi:hypothetical protein